MRKNIFDRMSDSYDNFHLKSTEIHTGKKSVSVSPKLKLILGWSIFVLCCVLGYVIIAVPGGKEKELTQEEKNAAQQQACPWQLGTVQACHLVTGSSDPQSVVPSGAYPAPVAVPAGGGQRGSVRAAELQRGPVSCGALLRALRCVRGLEQVRRVWCPWVPQRLGPSTQRSRLAGGAGLSWWGWATPPCSELFCKAGSSMLLFPPGG